MAAFLQHVFWTILVLVFVLSFITAEDAIVADSPTTTETVLETTNATEAISPDIEEDYYQLPTVLITILIRNKAIYLPYFFGCLERLDYDRRRIGLFIRVDHSVDNSSDIVDAWLEEHKSSYHYVDYKADTQGEGYKGEGTPHNWTAERFQHVMALKQESLETGRRLWANYLLSIDVDVMLTNPTTLQNLMQHDATLVGPLLNCTNSDSYSNFWGEADNKGYYKRSSHYFDIVNRWKQGVFPVRLIHGALLINLNHRISQKFYFDPKSVGITFDGPVDDFSIMVRAVRSLNISFFIVNDRHFGYIALPEDESSKLDNDIHMLNHFLMQIMHDQQGKYTVQPSAVLPVYMPKKTKLNFDEIFMINLLRRTDRKAKMDYCFDLLGIDYRYFEAVDGRDLNKTYLDTLGVNQLEGYYDPYHKRSLKFGEIGCFLSHYFIWQEMLEKGYETILIFEDDIRFDINFNEMVQLMLKEANTNIPDWDLIYVGRKRMTLKEAYVNNTQWLVHPEYSYWTLSYILNARGAAKLLSQQPLTKLVAVDEFLPIMYQKHPREAWSKFFEPRNLVAISTQPILVEPSHYTGERYYFSDTEDSQIIPWEKSDSASSTCTKDSEDDACSAVKRTKDEIVIPNKASEKRRCIEQTIWLLCVGLVSILFGIT